MYFYVAYGLRIRSSLPFPELIRINPDVWDIDIRLEKVKKPLPSSITREPYLNIDVKIDSSKAYLFWEHVGAMLVQGGKEIIIDPIAGLDDRVLRLHILGTAMGVLFQQRGQLALHASAVSVEGQVIAFLGDSGFGKSTLAAAFHRRGYGLVADDVLALRWENKRPVVYPAFPRLKLWEDTAVAVGYSSESLPRIHPFYEKLDVQLHQDLPQAPLPLKSIYVLSKGKDPGIEPLAPQQTVLELMGHTYRIQLLHPMHQPDHFLQCTELANKVPVSRLFNCYSFSALTDLVNFVEEDITAFHSQ